MLQNKLLRGDPNNLRGEAIFLAILKGDGCGACVRCANYSGSKNITHIASIDSAFIANTTGHTVREPQHIPMDELLATETKYFRGQIRTGLYFGELDIPLKIALMHYQSDLVFVGTYTCLDRCDEAARGAMHAYSIDIQQQIDRIKLPKDLRVLTDLDDGLSMMEK